MSNKNLGLGLFKKHGKHQHPPSESVGPSSMSSIGGTAGVKKTMPVKRQNMPSIPVGNVAKKIRIEHGGDGDASTSSTAGGLVAVRPLLGEKGTSKAASTKQHAIEFDPHHWKGFTADLPDPKPTDELFYQEIAKARGDTMKMAKILCYTVYTIGSSEKLMLLASDIVDTVKNSSGLSENPHVLSALLFIAYNLPVAKFSETIVDIFQLVTESLKNINEWPIQAVEYTLNDALGDRNLMESITGAQQLLLLLLSELFYYHPLNIPSERLFQSTDLQQGNFLIDMEVSSLHKKNLQQESQRPKFPKSDLYQNKLIEFFMGAVNQPVTKNFIRTIGLCVNCDKIMLAAAKGLDAWLQNGKFQRYAMELLLFIACNFHDPLSPANLDCLKELTTLRMLKSKQIMSVYQIALREILTRSNDSLCALVNCIVDNCINDTTRAFQHSIPLFQQIYAFDQRRTLLAITQKLMKRMEPSQNLKRIRSFLRDFVRSVCRHEFPFEDFAEAFFRQFLASSDKSPHIQQKLFNDCVKICSSLPFLALTPTLKELIVAKKTGVILSLGQKETFNRFLGQLRTFFTNCIKFLHDIEGSAISFADDKNTFVDATYQLLFIFGTPSMYSDDDWPTDADCNLLARYVSECPTNEVMIRTILSMVSQNNKKRRCAFSSSEAMDLLEILTERHILQYGFDSENVIVASVSIVNSLFEITKIETRSDSALPKNICFADRALYWRAWYLTTVWAICSRGSFLKTLYDSLPNLRLLLAMIISKDFLFPPPGLDGKTRTQLMLENQAEKAHEGHDNKMVYNPSGPVRAPDEKMLSRLQAIAEEHSLRALLCECRDPDILFRLTQDQGPQRAMPAVQQYCCANPRGTESVPLSALCQYMMFLLVNQNTAPGLFSDGVEEQSDSAENPLGCHLVPTETQLIMIKRLSSAICDPQKRLEEVREIVDIFLSKLSSGYLAERKAALTAIRLLLSDPQESTNKRTDDDGLVHKLSRLAHFSAMKDEISLQLSKCCSFETDIARVVEYIHFISTSTNDLQTLFQITNDLTPLVARASADDSPTFRLLRGHLVCFFAHFMRLLMDSEAHQDGRVFVPKGRQASKDWLFITKEGSPMELTLPPGIVEAQMELLCSHETENISKAEAKAWDFLMGIWFPIGKLNVCRVGNLEESVNILPLRLKVRMMSSRDEKVVNVALEGISPEQALHFIQSFGLTHHAFQRLFSILKQIDLSTTAVDRQLLRQVIPFLHAYKRNSEYRDEIDKFISQIGQITKKQQAFGSQQKEQQSTSANVDLNEIAIVNPHQFSIGDDKTQTSFSFDSIPLTIEAYMKEMISANETTLNEALFSAKFTQFLKTLSGNESIAENVLRFISANLKRFPDERLSPFLLATLLTLSKREEMSTTFVENLEALIFDLKKLPENPQIKFVIDLLHTTVSSRKTHQPNRQEKASSYSSLALLETMQKSESKFDVTSILQRLVETTTINSDFRELLRAYVLLRPEIVDVCARDFTNQISLIFTPNTPGSVNLSAELRTRASVSTLKRVFAVLLNEQNTKKFQPRLVLDFVFGVSLSARGSDNGQQLVLPTAPQCPHLLEYLSSDDRFQSVQQEAEATTSNNRATTIRRFIDLIRLVVDKSNVCINNDDEVGVLAGVQVWLQEQFQRGLNASNISAGELHPETQQLREGMGTVESIKRLKTLEEINHQLFQIEFPEISPKCLFGAMIPHTNSEFLLPLEKLDVLLHRQISELFEQLRSTDKSLDQLCENLLKNLLAEAEKNPHLIARQIPLLSIQISTIGQMNAREFRQNESVFFKFLNFVLDVLIVTAPKSFEDAAPVKSILLSYFNFYELRKARGWQEVHEKTLRVCLKFIESNLQECKEFLRFNGHVLQDLIKKFPQNAAIVRENIFKTPMTIMTI